MLHTSADLQHLKPNLEVLHKTIILATLAIQAYEYTPIGCNLTLCISFEVDKCCELLRALLDKMQASQAALGTTRIRSLWGQIWQMGSKDGELADHQRVLGGALMALSS